MNIKCIIFDLDGVLVEAKHIHFESLNKALVEENPKYEISMEEHLLKFDGLKTDQKLKLLTKEKGLPENLYQSIWNRKQELTAEALFNLKKSENLIDTFKRLKKDKYKLICCSNSIRNTVYLVLSKLEIIHYFDYILSNQDVNNSKPHPEIYWKAIGEYGLVPEEVLIVEDSPTGLAAATSSGAHVLRVVTPEEVTYKNINDYVSNIKYMNNNQNPWVDKNLNVLIPMAGAGSRFSKVGYDLPKPLIDVNHKPMIQVVVENLNIDANFIFIVQKSHREKYNLDALLNLIAPDCKIVEVDGLTEGAACSTLLAKQFIDNDRPLIMANSDQYIEWNSNEFLYKMQEQKTDACILTFESTHPKWSYVKIENGLVIEVAEKNPISNMATVGIYYWKHGKDYVKYAEQMISKNIRVNNEFYVCPVFNEAVQDNKKITTFNIEKMWGIGTPEDLEIFLKNNLCKTLL